MKKLTRVLAAVMAILISAGSTGVFAVTAAKAQKETVSVSQNSEEKSSDVIKEETVYVVADSQGNKKNVIVSDWLDNKSGLPALKINPSLAILKMLKAMKFPYKQW